MNKTAQTIQSFNKMAQIYLDKFGQMEDYQDTFDVFCDQIPIPNPSILELACGPGNITSYLMSKRPDFKMLATDLAPKMLELGKKHLPNIAFELMDCRDLGIVDRQFDGIFCAFGLPYLSKSEALDLISNASEKLNSGGLLYISTMEDDYSKSGPKFPSNGGPDVTHTYYHESDYLKSALLKAGFEIVFFEVRKFTHSTGDTAKDLFIISKKL